MLIVAASIPADTRVTAPDDLLERFRAGDDAAFTRVVELHHRQVTATVRRLMAWRGDCDDVVQEVFLTALRQRKTFRGDSAIATWLTAIAILRCRGERRKSWWKRWKRHERELAVESRECEQDETAAAVRLAVAKLSPKDREVIVLFHLEEMTGAEVAKTLGISPAAVDVRLHRARAKLKALLKEV